MLLSTNTPGLQNYDPSTAGQFTMPPVGIYNEQFKVISHEDITIPNTPAKINITFEILTGEQEGFSFTISHNVGDSNPKWAEIAIRKVVDIAYGATGNKDVAKVERFAFDAQFYNKPFNGMLTVEISKDKSGKVDDNGNIKEYKNGKFTKIKPIEQPDNQPQQAGNYNQTQPTAVQNDNQQQQPAPQSVQNATIAWGQPK